MQHRHYRDLIIRAVLERDNGLLDRLAVQLADAERAREILHANGYGASGMSASATAAQVPQNR